MATSCLASAIHHQTHYVFYGYIMCTNRVVTLQITPTPALGYRTLRLIQIGRSLAPHELARSFFFPPNCDPRNPRNSRRERDWEVGRELDPCYRVSLTEREVETSFNTSYIRDLNCDLKREFTYIYK